MCGIYGMMAPHGSALRYLEAADLLAAALRHRGPDGHGRRVWPDALIGVTRLRVIDLDPRADQPFDDATGTVTVAGNGEIYNAPALRTHYPGYAYRSASDTEVVLPLYLALGPPGLADLDGMFALAILDRRTHTLVLARDRAGEKPLFTARVGSELWFASEIGALLETGRVSRALDLGALRELLELGYIREPRTPFQSVRKVPAGTILVVKDGQESVLRYWNPEPGAAEVAPTAQGMRALIHDAVARQVRADVPVGVFTSGGLDSSLLAALAGDVLGPGRVHTFAVGFPDRAFDERPHAARLARALHMPHVAVGLDDDDVPAALDALAATGEPIADPAAIPTWKLAREARRHVTVVLSGEGADELFGGYPTYIGHRLAPAWARLPEPVRAALVGAAARMPRFRGAVGLDYLFRRFTAAADQPWRVRHLAWFGSGLPAGVFPDGPWVAEEPVAAEPADPVAAAMRLDYAWPLRERLLVKIDRATMRASLEARAPFLDPAVTRAAFAAGGAHVRGLATKRLLREVAAPLVPGFILRRRKRGLSVPVSRWLNGSLASLADRLLACGRLADAGLVDGRVVAGLLADHRAGRADHGRALWTLFVAQHWLEHWNLEVGT